MNGRCSSDRNIGKFTCDGKSVVDYVACSPELFHYCTKFEVVEFDNLLSDKHCPIIVNFQQCSSSSLLTDAADNIEGSLGNNSENFVCVKWASEQKSLFVSNIDNCKINYIIHMIEDIDKFKITQFSMNQTVSKIGNLFQESAKSSNMMKVSKTKNKQVKRKLPKKPWFNGKCESSRIIYFKSRNKYKNLRTEANLIAMKKNCRIYKKSLRKEYALYQMPQILTIITPPK